MGKYSMNPKTIDFNVKLEENDKKMLVQMSKDGGVTMSEIMRTSLHFRFRQQYANEPTCATGNRCLCPNMHTLNAASRPTDSEVLESIGKQNGATKTEDETA